MIVILTSVMYYHIVALIGMSLMISWSSEYLLLIFVIGCLGFFILGCMSCLYILDVNSLLVISFATISSCSIGDFLFCQWLPSCTKAFKFN